MNFKKWLNEYTAVGLKGLFRNTCGDKSCSRGSSLWLPDFESGSVAKDDKFTQVPLNFGQNTKGYYDEDNNRFSLVIEVSQILKDKNRNSLIEQLLQKSRQNIEGINQNKILSFINSKINQNQQQLVSNDKFNQLKYFKNYIAKDSLIIVYQLI